MSEETNTLKQMNEVDRFERDFKKEGPQAGMVLEVGEFNMVRLGTFAEVIYGKGDWDPVSMAWARSDTVRGYVEAVDEAGLTIGKSPGLVQVAYERVQKLHILAKPVSRIARHIGTMDYGSRMVIKATSGLLGGYTLAIVVGFGGFIMENSNRDDNCTGSLWCVSLNLAAIGALCGYTLGLTAGVSMVDPYDRSMWSLLGTLAGIGAVVGLKIERPVSYFFPIAGAVIGSELSRKPPEVRRFSVGLAPNSNGKLSAVATFRF